MDYPYYLPSTIPHAVSSPLCAVYMHAARCVDDALPCLAVGDDEGRVHLLDTQTPPDSLERSTCLSSPDFVRHTTQPLVQGSVFALEWRADDQALAVGGSDYTVSAWDVQHEVCIASYEAHNGSVRALAWDPDGGGRILASGARDGTIHVWDLREAKAVAQMAAAHGMPRPRRRTRVAGVTSLAYLGAGKLASTGSENAVVRCWDMRAGGAAPAETSPDWSTTHGGNTRPHGLSSLVYAPSRARLFAACTDGR